MRTVLLLVMALIVGGCATDPGRPSKAKSFTELAAARPLVATVYIYRPGHNIARLVWPEVFFNDSKVVGLRNESYAVVYLKPGRYVIRTEKNMPLSGMGNIPGEFEIPNVGTYFLKLDLSYTEYMGHAGNYAIPSFKTNYERWVLVSQEAALPELKKCYYIEPYVETLAP